MAAGPAVISARESHPLHARRPCGSAPAGTCPVATGEPPMNRYVAPLGFTLAAVWVVVIFVLASGTH